MLLDAMFDRCTHGLALVDTNGRFLRVNPSLAGLLQRETAELVGSDYRSCEPEGDVPRSLHDQADLRGATMAEGTRRTVWKRRDGGLEALQLRVWPVRPSRERRLAGYAVEVWSDGSG